MESTETRKCWASCLLTSTLITHLEEKYPDAAKSFDYRPILSAAGLIQDIPDARDFLVDPNNWVPQEVIRELIKYCEAASGVKDFTYQATLAHYKSTHRPPTLIESIAIFLNDIETALRSASEFAPAYTNYLKLQAFSRADESQTLHIIAQYRPPLEPLTGNIGLVRGTLEGIAKLDPAIEAFSMTEEICQVQLATIVMEFGNKYVLTPERQRVSVKEAATGKVVAVAKPVVLDSEWIPPGLAFLQTSPSKEDHLVIGPDAEGGITTLLPTGQPLLTKSRSTKASNEEPALRIEEGGTLSAGRLSFTLKKGAVYGAPYSRYRVQWKKGITKAELGHEADTAPMRNKKVYAQLVFNHLKNLQATQRRTLSMMMRNVELAQENVQLMQELSAQQNVGGLIGKSKAMQDALALIRTIAASDTTVLITGETGCGKELAARLIHQLSKRGHHRFVAVNCGAIPESLLESELFGHERGAFTGAVSQAKGKFEAAEGGTIFLDEIADLPQPVQVKLLRVLQEKEFQRVGGTADLKADVRVIAATNRDLEGMMEQNQFRRDLYYRLNVIQVYMPSLRERLEDFPELAQHFMQRLGARTGKPIQGLTAEALNLCLHYKWPGNIRELENVIERAITLAPENCKLISPDLLPPNLQHQIAAPSALELTDLVAQMEWSSLLQSLRNNGSLTSLLHQLEWVITNRAVTEYGGNKSRAARTLGRTYRWLRKLETEMAEDETSPPSPNRRN